MTIKTTLLGAALVAAIGLSAGKAEAQCGSWTCSGPQMQWESSSNPARLVLNTTNAEFGNMGIGLRYNGIAQWSVATVNTSGLNNPIHVFQIYNDLNGTLAVQIDPNGTMSTRQVWPRTDNTFDLGTTGLRWKRVFAANGTIQTSDGRHKKDVADLRYGLDQILKLRPVTFKWKDGADDGTHIGLIAQEVEKVIPEVVKHGRPADPLAMSYSELIPVLVKAVQSQEQTISKQAEQIARLEKSRAVASNSPLPQVLGASVAFAALPGLGMVLVMRRRRRT